MGHTAYIGRRKSDKARVWVTLELRTLEPSESRMSTEHAPIVGAFTELSVQGSAVGYGRREVDEGGQMTIDPDDIEPAEGWTRKDVHNLVDIWARWHLNGMRAGCAHVPEPLWETNERYGYRQPDLKNTPACRVSGYRYGHAWLAEELPAEIVTEVRRLMALPVGNVPEYVA